MAEYLEQVHQKYKEFTELLIRRKLTVTTMESCTSGLIASLITDTEGASAIMKGAFITYSNEAKVLAGVPADTIEQYTVYSLETARSMAEAARSHYDADLAIGVTGSLGRPDPANISSVPGQVYFAIATRNSTEAYYMELPSAGDRFTDKLAVADAVCRELLLHPTLR